MVFSRRRLSRVLRDYWFGFRFDILALEGFTPEEAALIANTRISSGPVRRLRRSRKRRLARVMSQMNLSRSEAIEAVRNEIRGTDEEIIDWDMFRHKVYGDKGSIVLMS